MEPTEELIKKIEELEDISFSSYLDISSYFAPDKTCVKFLLKQKFPFLKEEDIIDFVEDEKEGLENIDLKFKQEEEEEEKLEDERELQEGSSDNDNEAKRNARKAKREQTRQEMKARKESEKKRAKEQLQERKKIYKDRLVEYIEEVKRIKRDIKAAVHKLFAEFFNLGQKLITGLVKSVQTIVAVITMIVAPPWNIPGAIVTLLSVVEFFLDIIKQLKDVATVLEPLRQLGIVVDPSVLDTVTSLINAPIIFILGLFTVFEKFDLLITKLMEKLMQLIRNSDKKKRAFRKATRRLRKYNYCQNGEISEDDREEIEEILEIYKVGPCSEAGYSINNCNICVIGYQTDDEGEDMGNDSDFSSIKDRNGNSSSIDTQINIFNEFRDISNKIGGIKTISSGSFLYDVLLPDGTILANQTQDSLEKLRKEYQLLFTNLE